MTADQSRIVVHVPGGQHGPSSYVGLLAQSLLSEGWFSSIDRDSASNLWRLGWLHSAAVVHLHWIEFVAPTGGRGVVGAARTIVRQTRLLAVLTWLRLRGVGIVWTVHNLTPHEPVWPALERRLFRAVMTLTDRAIVHSEYARRRTAGAYSHRRKIRVIPHGSYVGVFEMVEGREATRARLDIPPHAFVLLGFGQVRPYKRLSELAALFARIEGEDLRLVIAGQPKSEAESSRLQELSRSDPRVILDLRRIPDHEVGDVHAAADVAVIAYRDVFSSGALLLALSCGLRVVAPAGGTPVEVASPPVLEAYADGELETVLRRLVAEHVDGSHRPTATWPAEQFSWTDVARATATVYGEALSSARGRSRRPWSGRGK